MTSKAQKGQKGFQCTQKISSNFNILQMTQNLSKSGRRLVGTLCRRASSFCKRKSEKMPHRGPHKDELKKLFNDTCCLCCYLENEQMTSKVYCTQFGPFLMTPHTLKSSLKKMQGFTNCNLLLQPLDQISIGRNWFNAQKFFDVSHQRFNFLNRKN